MSRWRRALGLGRIRVRLLAVNLVVLLVPVAGLEFARVYERQLLHALERDMGDQASLVRALVEDELAHGAELGSPKHERILARAAAHTRTRIRLLDAGGALLADSHRDGPPEGPEPAAPSVLPAPLDSADVLVRGQYAATRSSATQLDWRRSWPAVEARNEVRTALRTGARASYTRVRLRPASVFLFLAEPVRSRGRVVGCVYVARSTQPVLVELYRIRSSLIKVLAIAIVLTALVTILLAWSISRPLGRLARAARHIADGQRNVHVPVGGGGELHELGEAVRDMTTQLEERMRYTSDFAADVAHEFKSPLTSIRGAAELLGEGAADDPEARQRFLRNIELDVQRLDRLVSRLLELGRIEASTAVMQPVDLAALAARVTARCETPDVAVRFVSSTARRIVPGRETDLETALFNLVDNAVRFSPPGATVEVRLDQADRALTLAVRDHGPGIPAANLPRVFDRFFTTDAERRGTGLGLAIVRSVARAHGGDAEVRSTPGEGATFVLRVAAA